MKLTQTSLLLVLWWVTNAHPSNTNSIVSHDSPNEESDKVATAFHLYATYFVSPISMVLTKMLLFLIMKENGWTPIIIFARNIMNRIAKHAFH